LDLESPLSKILDLLDRLGSGDRRRRPSATEATELRLLVAAHSANLASPVALRRQLRKRNSIDKEVADFLFTITMNGEDQWNQSRDSSRTLMGEWDSLTSSRTPSVTSAMKIKQEAAACPRCAHEEPVRANKYIMRTYN
jgi:hypothetical protein